LYNAAGTLPELLESRAAQDYRGDEVIMADNGSTDGSVAVSEGYRSRLPRLTVVDAFGSSRRRRGGAHARNVRARASAGSAPLPCLLSD
jgi:glycosyltransferase involved in cell wall biosynthesis